MHEEREGGGGRKILYDYCNNIIDIATYHEARMDSHNNL